MGFLALFYPEMKALCGLKVIENIFDFTGGNFNVKNCWKKSEIVSAWMETAMILSFFFFF